MNFSAPSLAALAALGACSSTPNEALGPLAKENPYGELRTFLEDGDTIALRGRCEREGCRPIGFGECRGTVLPAG